ncbi:putative ceramide glucosyltransferase [Dactylonectria estremocensis]|uniref:Ceramide glucosyltransferase n=1 Tax=Dactylonectria estremocensis TaxID=1079267 RepID=A0A9P9J5N5_9HYPO|nr:putative ceramide glucosyltransferase [Dactylonectria estremocensis]
MTSFTESVAWVCLGWSVIVVVVETIGIRAILRNYKRPLPPPVSPKLQQDAPHVTLIRPVKGVEPQLYECIASSFLQDYPADKLHVRLCVDDKSDSSYPILQKIVEDFPAFDARVLVESEDPVLHGSDGDVENLGPNPKIRNISRAYREAKGDIIWIADCNVWIGPGILGRMVDKLMGYEEGGSSGLPYKFVHQMPIVVDLANYSSSSSGDSQSLLNTTPEGRGSSDPDAGLLSRVWAQGGGRLDEMFMSTTHAKFYGAINAVGVAPCVVGKSNMFRKSQLDQITNPAENPNLPPDSKRPHGVDFFSHNICEDHLIGDLFWKSTVPGHRNHGIIWGDLVVQPMSGMSVGAYAARRGRWLRARKFTVPAATLVEPGVEPFLCCAYMAFSATTLPFFRETLGVPQTWSAMGSIWLLCVTTWMLGDRYMFRRLHSGLTMVPDANTPYFAKGAANQGGIPARPFLEWLSAWLGRETLALPIWIWAVMLGRTVHWRGKSFRVRLDATVYEVTDNKRKRVVHTPELERASSRNKHRVD